MFKFVLLFAALFLSHHEYDTIQSLMKKHRVPGVAVAFLKNGEITYHCYGYGDKKQKIPISHSTDFQLGSLSKTFAAWGILKLVEEGKICLDDPIEKYLKRWRFPDSDYNSADVTVRRVLNHTAGLSVSSYYGYQHAPPDLLSSLNGVRHSHRPLKIQYPPGVAFHYSGGGYTLLQLLIEEIVGCTYAHFIRDQIFSPLNLNHSHFSSSDVQTKGYTIFGMSYPPLFYIEHAAAGLCSTIEDTAHFIQHTLDLYSNNEILKSMMRVPKTAYGLGYDVELLADGTSLVYHEGANPGWRAGMYLLPELKSGLVILTNSDRGTWLIEDLLEQWIKEETGTRSFRMQNICFKRLVISCLFWILSAAFFMYTCWKAKRYEKQILTLKLGFFLVFCLGWIIVFYTPLICCFFYKQGSWIIASFMPAGFDKLTIVVVIWFFTSAVLRPLHN